VIKPRHEVTEYSPAIERNLLATYYRANTYDLENGVSWYQMAHNICERISTHYGVTLAQACGVIAALSPGRDWNANVADAELFISHWVAGNRGRKLPAVGTYGRANRYKAISILEGDKPLDVLGGPKVRSFYANMLNPSDESPVTVDRHAKCACYGLKNEDMSIVRPYEYEYLAEHFRRAASKVQLTPCAFQAICWVTWRRLNGVLAQEDLFAY